MKNPFINNVQLSLIESRYIKFFECQSKIKLNNISRNKEEDLMPKCYLF